MFGTVKIDDSDDENISMEYVNDNDFYSSLMMDQTTIRRMALAYIQRCKVIKGYFVGQHLEHTHLVIIYWFHNTKLDNTIVSKYDFNRLKRIRKLFNFSGFIEYSEINLAKNPIFNF